MAQKLSHFSGYDPRGPGSNFSGAASGATDDWSYATLGAAGMTWEIGTDFHQDCSVFVQDVVPRNLEAFTYAALLAHRPYRLSKGPDIVSLAMDRSVLMEGENLTVSVHASDSAYSNPTIVEGAGQNVQMVLFFLDKNPFATVEEDQWLLASDWSLSDDELDDNGMGNRTIEWPDVKEILENQNATLEGRHVIYTMAIDQNGYPGVLSAVEFVLESRTSTPAPTSIRSDSPSMIPSSQPSDVGSLPPSSASLVTLAPAPCDPLTISCEVLMQDTSMETQPPNLNNSAATAELPSDSAIIPRSSRFLGSGVIIVTLMILAL
jgi:carboxypeptidase T